jgi:hypothetical protein
VRTINVASTPNGNGWTCVVRIDDDGRTVSEHSVTVTKTDKERLAPQSPIEDLVTRSFEFLLEREPPTSILRQFKLTEIERYFPEYARVISGRPNRPYSHTTE